MIGAILLAAGSGTRYHGKKQDLEFHGKALWRYAYATALSVVGDGNIVAVGKDILGCTTRTRSVMKGLEALPKVIDRVICCHLQADICGFQLNTNSNSKILF